MNQLPDFEKDKSTCSEFVLYETIQAIGGIRWRLEHDFSDGRIEITEDEFLKRMVELTEALRAHSAQIVRFGVDKPLTEEGGPTDSYWEWYKKWNSWARELTEDQVKVLNELIISGEGKEIYPGMEVS